MVAGQTGFRKFLRTFSMPTYCGISDGVAFVGGVDASHGRSLVWGCCFLAGLVFKVFRHTAELSVSLQLRGRSSWLDLRALELVYVWWKSVRAGCQCEGLTELYTYTEKIEVFWSWTISVLATEG